MATADSALLVIAKALWLPRATTNDKSERYLANALGYPRSWRVVRKIEEVGGEGIEEEEIETSIATESTEKEAPTEGPRTMIVDRIYAGPPSAGVDMYFNHHAAQAAAADWVEGESSGYERKGGQLLPRKPKFQKGDQVKVSYEGKWIPATIQKRNERKEGYRYTVLYSKDDTIQTQVEEYLIEHVDDPVKVAESMGLDGGWQARFSSKKWKYVSPDGKTFTSKAAALKHKQKMETGEDGSSSKKGSKRKTKDESEPLKLTDGDPPWRTTGHEFLGRRVVISSEHQKSATRTVTIEQVGTIVGWIADTDVDSNGEPGYVSETTNKPANLFHCVFDDEASHPYFTLLVVRKDLEEYEVLEALVDEDEPAKKKRKT